MLFIQVFVNIYMLCKINVHMYKIKTIFNMLRN